MVRQLPQWRRAVINVLTRTAVALAATAPLLALGVSAAERVNALDAHMKASNMALVVFQDLPGGAAVLSGRYQEGLDESLAAAERTPKLHVVELATNMCAARVKLGQLDAANTSCELALARRAPVGTPMTAEQYRAIAHVNHGVVHFAQGDTEFAAQEFRQARNLFPSLGVASSNLAFARNELRRPRVIVGETL